MMPKTVADLCADNDMTAEQLAERAGLEVGRITAILMRRWTPSPAERQRVAAVFEVSVDQIVWGHATPIQHLYGHGPA